MFKICKGLFLVLVCLAPSFSFARLAGTPFKPEIDRRFDQIERATGDVTFSLADPNTTAIGASKVTQAMLVPITANGLHANRIARATFDFAVHTGAVGTYSLDVALPAKSVIIRSWFQVVTQFVDAGSGTVAIQCEDANNIKTATDITGSAALAIVEGQSTGAASAFIASIAAACNISVVLGGVDITAGKLIVFVEYVVGE